MIEPSLQHDTIVVERIYASAPRQVYRAWIDPDGRQRWDVPGAGWDHRTEERDVRVGGRDVVRFGPPGALRYRAVTTYLDLVEDTRLVATYTVTERIDAEDSPSILLSVSVLSVELHRYDDGTRMVVTEQAVFLDGHDSPADRLAGLTEMLDALGRELG